MGAMLVSLALAGLLSILQSPAPSPSDSVALHEAKSSVGHRLNVLFLGDHGHHRPMERLGEVFGPLLRMGFAIDWEDDLAYVTQERLADYDCVVMYANQAQHARVPEPFLETLRAFVRGGGGFVALHCTSGCFMQSDEWREFVGARFVSHGAEVFQQEVVAPEHPVVRDWPNFSSWDETYVQQHGSGERVVLTVRGDEPWSWVRQEDAGRIFYSASGHDGRTWQQPGFLDLLVRAMDWTSGEEAAQARRAWRAPQFEYAEHEWVPNYEGRDPKLRYQKPSTPQQARDALIVPAGFEAVLFASEPMVVNPVAMTWDGRGRCWVLESPDYPNRVEEGGAGGDRLSILEDRDGDGRADHKTVFQDGLNLPTGLVRTTHGAIVAQAPELIWLEDLDGDDRAERRTVLFTGFGRWDTHAGPSNLQWGPDGYLWGAVGYAGFEGASGNRFGSGLWRWKVGMDEPEFMAQFTNNTWGLGFRDDGEIFGSTANGAPSFFVGVPKNVQARSAPSAPGAAPAFDTARFFPALEHLRQGDFFGQYTSAAGHHFATGAAMPPGWDDRVAFVCGPTGHLVGRFQAVPDGSGYRMQNAFNLCSSLDEWFCPVQAEVGPDDAVWVADFAQFIILHNLPGQPERGLPKVDYGDGNAHVNPLRDTQHGRIFRIVRKGWEASYPDLENDEADGAWESRGRKHLEALGHPNRFWRKLARRRFALRDYWAPTEFGQLSGDGLYAVIDSHSTLDIAAMLLRQEQHPWSEREQKLLLSQLKLGPHADTTLLAEGLLETGSLPIQRHTLMAAARMPQAEVLGVALASFALTQDWSDRWITQALQAAVVQHADPFLAAARPLLPKPEPESPKNLFPNPGFEFANADDASVPLGWRVRVYSGKAEHTWEAGMGRNASRALVIRSTEGADTSWCTEVEVEPRTRYRLSGWIRSTDLTHPGGTHGALFNLHPRHVVTESVQDSSGWTRVQLEFETGADERRVSINALYGGWGRSTGEAVYDDVELLSLGPVHDLSALVALAERFASDAEPGRTTEEDAALLTGGSPEAGRELFFQSTILACSRCHVWNGEGGALGPDLTTIGARLTPEQLLEAIEDPNATLAPDWKAPASVMPALRPFLTDEELRDLIAFLAASREPKR